MTSRSFGRVLAAAIALSVALYQATAQSAPANPKIRLATTTSTEQSGLLGAILPEFERATGYKVDVVAVGTGAALKLAENGDADLVLDHDPTAEKAFVEKGFGIDRRDVMYNDFIVLGPKADPARAKAAKTSVAAFAAIASARASFVSRGDKSGTHSKEKAIWAAAKVSPVGSWYKEAGQGMSQVIQMAGSLEGYTLADRGTWIAVRANSPLEIVQQGDPGLFNPYAVIRTNPARHAGLNVEGALALADWLTSDSGKTMVESYRLQGEQLFFLYK